MTNKKQLPLEVLEAIRPLLKESDPAIIRIDHGEDLLRIIDSDKNSTFYFYIKGYKYESTSLTFTVDVKPNNKQKPDNKVTQCAAKSLLPYLKSWLSLIHEYNTIETVYDDPIQNAYEKEFYSEFEILEDDAGIAPFNTTQVLALDAFLLNIETNIESHANPQNETYLLEIKNEVSKLRSELTQKTKSYVVKNLSKICAKIAKLGVKFIQEFLDVSRKEILKKGFYLIVENAEDLVNKIQ